MLASCAGLDRTRVAVGGGPLKLKAEADGFTDSDKSSGVSGRVELAGPTSIRNTTAGLYVGGGRASFDPGVATVDEQHLSLGGVLRGYLGEGRLRPFAEVRGGYRHTFLDVSQQGFAKDIGDGAGFEIGAGAGLELRISNRFSIFGQVDFEHATTEINDFRADFGGPQAFIGGEIRF